MGNSRVFWAKLFAVVMLVAISSTLLVVRAAENSTAATPAATDKKDVIDTATGMPELSQFVAYIKDAGLTEQLKGAGPFTVFAPNNDAYGKMSERMKTNMTSPDNKDRMLGMMMKGTVANGKMTAEELQKAGKVQTLAGREATIESSDGKLLFNNAEIVKKDIACSNGIIQVLASMPRGQRGAGMGGKGKGGRKGGGAAAGGAND